MALDTETWFVYILEVSDGSYYTGISTDLQRRLKQHKSGRGGAKYFRGRKPLQVLYSEQHQCRSAASRREYQLKKLSHLEKTLLIEKNSSE